MHLRAPLVVCLAALTLVACSAEVAGGDDATEATEEALLCADTEALVVDPSDPSDADFGNVVFTPAKATWWDTKNDAALQRLRDEARRANPGAFLVRETVTRNGTRFRYAYRTFRPEAALPNDIVIEGLGGCRWSRDDTSELAKLRADARAVASRNASVITFERVRVERSAERWRYEYRYDAPVVTKPTGVTFVPASMEWRADDQKALEPLRRAAQDDATTKRLRVTSETVTANGAEWTYAYRLGQ